MLKVAKLIYVAMETFIIRCLLFFTIIINNTYGQSLQPNSCDNETLTKQELEKCLADSAWNNDIVIKTNYISNLKTTLLPKYRLIRKELFLSSELQTSIQLLKKTYDTVLNTKLSVFLLEMDRNQKYVQPKAYLSSLLSLQTFRFYPDVYAILLNDIHLNLSPKTSIAELNRYNLLIENLFNSIPTDLYERLKVITTSLTDDNDKLKSDGFFSMFQGTPTQADIKKYQIINYLIWGD